MNVCCRSLLVALLLAGVGHAKEPDIEGPNPLRAFGRHIADVVDRVLPSVVVIRTEAIQYHLGRDYYYGHLYRIPELTAGQGSGSIISEDGYVLTSNHVVDKAQQIEVVLDDGTRYPARLIGSDPQTDLAVLKIEPETPRTFPALAFGDSDKIRVGEVVIAVGSPYNLNGTVTMGIVSQKGRVIGMLPYEDFIQTQAPINPGNSGGPLVDADGRMVGINAAIHKSGPYSDGNVGIGFAVPANLAMRVARSLIETGKIDHPWIGVLMQPAPDGVGIQEVYRDSPAEAGGVQRGDVIVRVNDRPISNALDVRRVIYQAEPDQPLQMTVLRDGETLDLSLKPGKMPDFNRMPR